MKVPEGSWALKYPFRIQFSFATLQIHFIRNHHGKGLSVNHRGVPVLPLPVEHVRVLDQVVNCVDVVVALWVKIATTIHINCPVTFVFITTSLLCSQNKLAQA